MAIISFDRAVAYYDETRGFLPGVAEHVRDAIVAYVRATPDTRFMELGIGTGRVALPFIEAGYVYDGVDVSPAMMAKLEEKISALATANNNPRSAYHCELIEADITHGLPIPDSAYDVAIMVHVLHLIENWQAALTETRRVLRPDSWLLIVGTEGNRSNRNLSIGTSANSPINPDSADKREPHDGDPDAIRQVRVKWDAILSELGVSRQDYRPRVAAMPDFERFLQASGATTEVVDLLEYDYPAISPRIAADRIVQRMYSGEWNLPDEIHAEAVKRLEAWFSESVIEPDKLLTGKGFFRVLSAHWHAKSDLDNPDRSGYEHEFPPQLGS